MHRILRPRNMHVDPSKITRSQGSILHENFSILPKTLQDLADSQEGHDQPEVGYTLCQECQQRANASQGQTGTDFHFVCIGAQFNSSGRNLN
jgi:hypothetical protein